jgi:hypothetical protein
MNELLGPLVLFAAAVTLTPGPNVVLVTASAANFGFRRTVPQMVGITFGFGTMVLATGLGLAGMVHAEPRLHTVMKYAGAAYLLYLAWRIAPRRRRQRIGAGAADRLRRGHRLHLDEPQGLGVGARRGGSVHDRGRQSPARKCADCRRAGGLLPVVGGALGGLRDHNRPLPRQSTYPPCFQSVDGGPAGAVAHPGALVTGAEFQPIGERCVPMMDGAIDLS